MNTSNLIAEFLSNPAVQAMLVALLVGFIPKGLLSKIPFLGPILDILTNAAKEGLNKAKAAETEGAKKAASILVEGSAQLIKTGKLDKGAASIQAQQELQKRYPGLGGATSKLIVERAVRELNSEATGGKRAPNQTARPGATAAVTPVVTPVVTGGK